MFTKMRKVSQIAPIVAEIKKISSLEIFLLQRKAGTSMAEILLSFCFKTKKNIWYEFCKIRSTKVIK